MLWDQLELVMFLIYWNQKEKLEDLDDLLFLFPRCTLIKQIKYFFAYISITL